MFCCRVLMKRLMFILIALGITVIILIAQTATFDNRSDGHDQIVYPIANGTPVPDDQADRLVWFSQITTLRLTTEDEGDILSRFEDYVNNTVPAINPSVVLCTGDLTRGYGNNTGIFDLQGEQREVEWQLYKLILTRMGYFNASFWWDVRGEHDIYGLSTPDKFDNYYLNYSVISTTGVDLDEQRVFRYLLNTTFGQYQLINVDVVQFPGLSWPYNYFGFAARYILDQLESVLQDDVGQSVNGSIVASHYGYASNAFLNKQTSSQDNTFADLLEDYNVSAWLSGHAGRGETYIRPMAGHETKLLILDNFEEHSIYRVAAFDNDLFSFIDCHLDVWPCVLITNPKNAMMIASTDPLGRLRDSTHVRVLVFTDSLFPISAVSMQIDSEPPVAMTLAQGVTNASEYPLYVAPFSPQQYAGLHLLTVTVDLTIEGEMSSYSIQHEFSTDGTIKSLGLPFEAYQEYFCPECQVLPSVIILFFFFLFLLLVLPALFLSDLTYKWHRKQRYGTTLSEIRKEGYYKKARNEVETCAWHCQRSSYYCCPCAITVESCLGDWCCCCGYVAFPDVEEYTYMPFTCKKAMNNCMRIWTYNYHTAFIDYGTMNQVLWIGNVVYTLYFLAGPNLFIFDSGVTFIFWWGMVSTSSQVPTHIDLMAMLFALVWMLGAMWPTFAISTMYRGVGELPRPRKASPYYWLLIWVYVLFCSGFYLSLLTISSWYTIFLSPTYFMSVWWTVAVIYMVTVSHQVDEETALEERAQARRERKAKLAKMRYEDRVARGTVGGSADHKGESLDPTITSPSSGDAVISVQPTTNGTMSTSKEMDLGQPTIEQPGHRESEAVSFSSAESREASIHTQGLHVDSSLTRGPKRGAHPSKNSLQSKNSAESSKAASATLYSDRPMHEIESSDDSDASFHSAVGPENASESTLTGI